MTVPVQVRPDRAVAVEVVAALCVGQDRPTARDEDERILLRRAPVRHLGERVPEVGVIEPAGLPAVRLEPLRKLRKLDKLSDEDMVNYQRINLLDSSSPNPSVETLLHAFLPHKFIDHVHSTAVLALTADAVPVPLAAPADAAVAAPAAPAVAVPAAAPALAAVDAPAPVTVAAPELEPAADDVDRKSVV